MRLSALQKQVVLRHRPGSKLYRSGTRWFCIWHDRTRAPADRWVGQVIHLVDTGCSPAVVVWAGSVVFARQRGSLIEALRLEAAEL